MERLESPAWSHWWFILLGLGVCITLLGALAMFLALQSGGINIWFISAALPFLLGLAVMAAAVQARFAPWLHVFIQPRPGQNPQQVRLHLPLPVGLGRWFIRQFSSWGSSSIDVPLDEIVNAMESTADGAKSHTIHIEGDEGDQVDLWVTRGG